MSGRRNSTPNSRASDGKKEIARVRRKYKVNTKTRRKLLPGEIPHVEAMVCVLKLAGYSGRQMSQVIGISRGQVAEILADPKVENQIVELRARIPAAAIELLQGYMIEAVQAIVDVMRTTEDDKLVILAAAEILDRAGVPKASRQERHNVNEERTTFGDDGIVERLRQASPEVQEEAAQIIERLESLLADHADVEAEITEESDDVE